MYEYRHLSLICVRNYIWVGKQFKIEDKEWNHRWLSRWNRFLQAQAGKQYDKYEYKLIFVFNSNYP